MVFWGAEVKPGKPFTHIGEHDGECEGTRLHLSQATLGMDGKGKDRTVVKCKVGDGPEHLLCSLTPGVSESCSLDLLFDQDVVFSVIGSTSVHLVGYYMPLDDEGDDEDYTFDSDNYSDDDEDDDDDDDFSVEEDSDVDVPATSVKIEEIEDDLNLAPQGLSIEGEEQMPVNQSRKVAKKKRKAEEGATVKKVSSSPVAKEIINASVSEVDDKGAKAESEDEDEDEDGFPLPPKKKQAANRSDETVSTLTTSEKQKGKKKKAKNDKTEKKLAQGELVENQVQRITTQPSADIGMEEKAPAPASLGNGVVGGPATGMKSKSSKKGVPAVRKFPNGLEIEEIAMGKPDGRQAKLGKRVSVSYTGKLKASGKVFDSNIRKKPFSFRLGVGEVIKGWDVAVAGMRIGDKRKITVPPTMAYGPKGVPGSIPGNAWLVFDVELIDVAK